MFWVVDRMLGCLGVAMMFWGVAMRLLGCSGWLL